MLTRILVLTLLTLALLLSGCSAVVPGSPAPQATVPTVLPRAVLPTATAQPTATAPQPQTVNLFQSLGLAGVVSIEVVPGMPGAQHTIIEAQTAQRLAQAFDVDLEPVGRSHCSPTYTLIFNLAGQEQARLDIVGCDLEHPPVVTGAGIQTPYASVQATAALDQVLTEIVSPLLPHPVPSPAPRSATNDGRVRQEVYDALHQALTMLRSQELAQSPAPDLTWTIVSNMLTDTDGSRHYQGQTVDWSAQIIQPAAEPGQENYAIKLFHEPSAFEWTTCIGRDGQQVLPRDPQAPHKAAEDSVPETVRLVLAQAVAYLSANQPDQSPAPTLSWRIMPDTPENLVGAAWYRLHAEGWEGRIIAPVVALSAMVYDVTLSQTDGAAHWALQVDAQGQVAEMPAAAAGTVEMVTYVDQEQGFTLTFRSDWLLDENTLLGLQERVLSLARDGWRLAISVAGAREGLPMVMGGSAGTWHPRKPVAFLDGEIDKQALVYDHQVKALKYYAEADGRIYSVHLLDELHCSYDQVIVLPGLENEIDQIMSSLAVN